MNLQPLYTLDNCKAAYQCRWSLSIFPKQTLPQPGNWLGPLNEALRPDNVRVLEAFQQANQSLLFLLSTTPSVAPPQIVRVVKGRLQHLLRSEFPVEYRRNFRLTSVGDANLATVEAYVAKQAEHHQLADPRSQQLMTEFQLTFPDVDLAEPLNSAHGQYVTALHIVLVHAERWRTAEPTFHTITRDAILSAASKKAHRLSRLSIVADHVHFTLRIGYEMSPAVVALSYMNNIAFRHGMLRMWMESFYVGTIGAYDMEAVRRRLLK
ncbi:MAG: hypothetical protein SGI77_17505 [Pirellulaceae bacterium]|nr:hypothetical protein [Pirellulaceae bacterium]